MPIAFADISVTTPTRDSLARRYWDIEQALDEGSDAGLRRALADWDWLRRELDSWQAMVGLRFHQDTADAQARADRDYADSLVPEAIGFEIALKRRLLAERDRVEPLIGDHALRLWETDVTTFEPAIAADLEREAKTVARYTELMSAAKISIGGATVNLYNGALAGNYSPAAGNLYILCAGTGNQLSCWLQQFTAYSFGNQPPWV